MNLTVSPSSLTGTVNAPPSKSMTLRALAAAFLSEGEAVIRNPSVCEDVKSACACLESLGTGLLQKKDRLTLFPRLPKGGVVSCGESALWFRMMAPILSLFPDSFTLTAEGSLRQRPVGMMIRPLQDLGVSAKSSGLIPPITVRGPLRPGRVDIDTGMTSQFLSGLLFALPLLTGPSVIRTKGLVSRPYVLMTMKFLAQHGIKVERDRKDTFYIPACQHFSKIDYTVEGDWSGSAFLLIAGALHGPVKITGLDSESLQGDRAILDVLRSAGAVITETKNSVTVSRGKLQSFDYDATDTPDLVPPLAVLASFCRGTSYIRGISRIKTKESDRSTSLHALLDSLGIPVSLSEDLMAITGTSPGRGSVSSYGDHRIVMAATLLASKASGDVEIRGTQAVAKSYPTFFDDYRKLGGLTHE
ncbi:MAG TPA: 3-phosphoshikimate 1-carboxyvinyltransferase [Candidatus Mcinerneyibacteriales bacterium]|nr:3-phosphoshikimate 1-carboxyvinyltransferase [Candidatus Mcinerneyibacteriales bacterium]